MEYKIKNDELILKDCPNCDNDRWNMQVCLKPDKQGLVHSWCCEFKGNIKSLALSSRVYREIYLIYTQNIDNIDGDADDALVPQVVFEPSGFQRIDLCTESLVLDYLKSRSVSIEDGKAFGLKYRQSELLFNLWEIYNQKLRYWIKRDIKTGRDTLPKMPKSEIVWYVNNNSDIVFIVEGIFDGIRAYQAGYDVILLLGKYMYEKVESFIKKVLQNKTIVVALDSDARDFTMRIASSLQDMKRLALFKYTQAEVEAGADIADLDVGTVINRGKDTEKYNLTAKIKYKVGR